MTHTSAMSSATLLPMPTPSARVCRSGADRIAAVALERLFGLPQLAGVPDRAAYDPTVVLRVRENLQRLSEYAAAHIGIVRSAHRMSQREIDQQRTRRLHVGGHLGAHGDRHRADPRLLHGSLNQSHGLVADASGGGQKRDVDFSTMELIHDGRSRIRYERVHAAAGDVPHQAVRDRMQ